MCGGGGQLKSPPQHTKSQSDYPQSICDIGCSNGDFLFYLSDVFPHAKLYGIDILPSLLEKTRQDFKAHNKPCPTLWEGDIQSGLNLPKERFDMVFLNGVIGIFDDLHKPLEHFANLINPKGVGYIWGCFNPYPIDVFIKGRVCGSSHLESGWNLHSKQSVLEICDGLGLKGVFYDDFDIGIDLPQSEDYLRTWTFRLEGGKRAIINGLSLVHNFSLLELTYRI
ncbi:class I SAM-dependent methyltransferase [Helicobacter jaachi]|uniref:class I SAM-dependent methyltransferase n=1 Tax=Helicobacter jaachi TaxID=1677920 RepID=UPI0009E0023D|nr:class I SAM-dependent methyltransferase [Helicobacter jaachi]